MKERKVQVNFKKKNQPLSYTGIFTSPTIPSLPSSFRILLPCTLLTPYKIFKFYYTIKIHNKLRTLFRNSTFYMS